MNDLIVKPKKDFEGISLISLTPPLLEAHELLIWIETCVGAETTYKIFLKIILILNGNCRVVHMYHKMASVLSFIMVSNSLSSFLISCKCNNSTGNIHPGMYYPMKIDSSNVTLGAPQPVKQEVWHCLPLSKGQVRFH